MPITTLDKIRILIVADDLTGACDTAAPFGSRAIKTEAIISWPPPICEAAPVLAINTASRDLPEEEAASRIASAIEFHGKFNPDILIKKVDSVFRGNTFIEIEEVLALLEKHLVFLVPAFPAQGRYTRNGKLFLNNDKYARLDIASVLFSRGIHPFRLSRDHGLEESSEILSAAISSGHRLFLCDAETQSDLTAIVEAVRLLPDKIVWIGSGGIANALAGSFFPPEHGEHPKIHLEGPVIFCIGSDHASTRRQVEHLCQNHAIIRIHEGDSYATLETALQQRKHVLLSMDREGTPEKNLRGLFSFFRKKQYGALFLTGGDTSLKVCTILSVQCISLLHEVLPGMPLGRLEGGICDGMSVITKSGGFGEDDTLTRIAGLSAH